MGNLILNSLEIRNFRGFQHLQIERLGRVNLIVGKNNIGKSSLLEALQLYASRGAPFLIWEQLRTRDEGNLPSSSQQMNEGIVVPEFDEGLFSSWKYLFYGRRDIRPVSDSLAPIQIGPIAVLDDTLTIHIIWSTMEVGEETQRMQLPLSEEFDAVTTFIPRLRIQVGNLRPISVPLNTPTSRLSRLFRTESKEINSVLIAANGLNRGRMGVLWDDIALTTLEKEVLTALRLIAPGVEGLNFVGGSTSVRGRTPVVKITGIDNPLPLRSLGDGMQRILGVALALVNAKGGILLIDEFENGLYYAVQPDLWRLIFRLANSLDVQVFATTHSWDCIEAFQRAAKEDQQEEGMLIRLESKKGEIAVTLYDERKLGIATREHIEVR